MCAYCAACIFCFGSFLLLHVNENDFPVVGLLLQLLVNCLTLRSWLLVSLLPVVVPCWLQTVHMVLACELRTLCQVVVVARMLPAVLWAN